MNRLKVPRGRRTTMLPGAHYHATQQKGDRLMRRTFPIFVGLALLAVFFVAAAAQGDTTEPADPAEAAGIFSEAQAQRGRTAFLSSCAECHGIRLNGGMGPALAGDS